MAVEYIRTFLSKQGYYDRVEFRPDNVLNGQQCVTVSSEIRHGKQEDSKLYSIWLDVLQHPENYPKSLHKYQLQPDLGGMMVLETLDVTFKVYISTSTLTIEGSFAEEWFLKNFLRILENSIDDDQLQLDQSSDVGNSELMSKESLDCELANLEIGGMRDGPTYIYKLWKSLLKMWISDGNEVYILSPFLDDKRLKDIADTCYDYKYTCSFPNSITIYTRQNCNNDRQISDLKIAISKDYDTEKNDLIKFSKESLSPLLKMTYQMFFLRVPILTAAILNTTMTL
ncbi:unnamed protein product [Owenia fusiformis]|uniref:Uncharacterized protein n=1 Tax=Owenia fusiformis TaxID=6347 RepID=A0A8J1UN62_OWEFU|nr:unnamed protein product [Owenia fusiformis]